MKPWNLQVRQGGRRLAPLLIALGLLLALGVLLWAPLFPGLILEDGQGQQQAQSDKQGNKPPAPLPDL